MKTHQEESRKDRVNTGGKPENDKVKGGIEPLEVEAFKRRIKEGDRLYCYRPRRKGDDEVILEKMSVIKPYEHIVTMAYHGLRGNAYETSMTWCDAIQLNRMTQKQLEREIRSMRNEMGIPCPNDSGPKEEKAPGYRRINRREYAGRIMKYRNKGMTYAQISCLVGIPASTVREIYIEEAKRNV